MIIMDTQPHSIVEDVGFKQLIAAAFPHYKIQCRKYFTTLIEKLEQLKSEINEVKYVT
jgi:hypothetical protein